MVKNERQLVIAVVLCLLGLSIIVQLSLQCTFLSDILTPHFRQFIPYHVDIYRFQAWHTQLIQIPDVPRNTVLQ